jgi:hypothetical protein
MWHEYLVRIFDAARPILSLAQIPLQKRQTIAAPTLKAHVQAQHRASVCVLPH